jgi:hypothetical protein
MVLAGPRRAVSLQSFADQHRAFLLQIVLSLDAKGIDPEDAPAVSGIPPLPATDRH